MDSELYSRLYRCEDCKEIRDPNGVFYFINGKGEPSSRDYLHVTIPVGHFGDVVNAKVWVILTNPKGDRNDSLVGLSVDQFGVTRRSQLKDEDVKSIFNSQCEYFKQNKNKWHPFFLPYVELLEGIKVGNQPISFGSGDVCFVDAIKCPTQKAWMGFVMSDEGKKVWDNCLRKRNMYLVKQLELHQPKIVLFCGTSGLIKAKNRGVKIEESRTFSKKLKLTIRHIISEGQLKQISIDFSNTKVNFLPKNELKLVREFISNSIASQHSSPSFQ